jgi:hypothetical protein
MGDLHMVIVYHIGQMVRGKTIRFQQNRIRIDVLVRMNHRTDQSVMEGGGPLEGNFQPDHIRFSRFFPLPGLFRRKIPAESVIPDGLLLFDLLFPKSFQALGTTETVVTSTSFHQFFRMFTVQSGPFGLEIGSIGPSHPRSFVPLNTQPFEGIVNVLQGSRIVPFPIGILYPQDEGAPGRPGKEIVKQSGPHPPYVL